MNRPDHIAATGPGRLYRGQTAVDFYGHRRIGLVVAIIVVVVTITSLFVQGLNLGLDFEGGQAWDVPASEAFGVDEAEDVLRDNDVPVAGSKIQLREAESLSFVAVQIEVVPTDQAQQITDGFAAAAVGLAAGVGAAPDDGLSAGVALSPPGFVHATLVSFWSDDPDPAAAAVFLPLLGES